MRDKDSLDPRGLIREAYRIEGIEGPSCRSIYLDWALGLPADADATAATATLLERYAAHHPDHPMTHVLREGVDRATPSPVRRRRRR
jgi:hypothetical protein